MKFLSQSGNPDSEEANRERVNLQETVHCFSFDRFQQQLSKKNRGRNISSIRSKVQIKESRDWGRFTVSVCKRKLEVSWFRLGSHFECGTPENPQSRPGGGRVGTWGGPGLGVGLHDHLLHEAESQVPGLRPAKRCSGTVLCSRWVRRP